MLWTDISVLKWRHGKEEKRWSRRIISYHLPTNTRHLKILKTSSVRCEYLRDILCTLWWSRRLIFPLNARRFKHIFVRRLPVRCECLKDVLRTLWWSRRLRLNSALSVYWGRKFSKDLRLRSSHRLILFY